MWHAPGWDDQELHDYGNEVSIENSVAVYGNTLYFGNSGGLIQGWNIAPLLDGSGEPQRIFRFWAGADTDGTITVDEHGILYVGSEWERHLPRSSDVGQMMALDPARGDDNALVWSQHDDGAEQAGVYSSAGIVGRPRDLHHVLRARHRLDRATGAIRWELVCPRQQTVYRPRSSRKFELQEPLLGSAYCVLDVAIAAARNRDRNLGRVFKTEAAGHEQRERAHRGHRREVQAPAPKRCARHRTLRTTRAVHP